MTNSIITVVRDPIHHLGKTFSRNPDGTISKRSIVNLSFGLATMHRVENQQDFISLLKVVSEDPHAAIINAQFKGIDVGQEFIIMSEREIESRLGTPRANRDKQKGIHEVTYNGKTYKAVGRFKENIEPSSWQYFDRDVDLHTPPQFRDLPFEEYLSTLLNKCLDIDDLSHITAASTSSRIMVEGVTVGSGNGHVWFKVKDPTDIERFRVALLVRAAQAGVTWLKPRFSRIDPTRIVGHSLITLVDTSVFTPGRLVFVGKPIAEGGLTVAPLQITSYASSRHGELDTSTIILPDPLQVREITRNAGVEMDVRTGANGLRTSAQDLTLDTELELEDGSTRKVQDIVAGGIHGKVRCQTPFRSSVSFAAFCSLGSNGQPFLYDVGTGITHWLKDSKQDDFEPREYTVVSAEEEPNHNPRGVSNPLDKFSLRGLSDEIEKRVGAEVAVLGGQLALKGQATVFYAAPNTGKTLITLALLTDAIAKGQVDPMQVYYINVDDTAKGLVEKLRIADEYRFHMLAEGYKEFKAETLLGILGALIENAQAAQTIIVLDTLKKFVDLMDKSKSSAFTKVIRKFILNGGTVIALAHTNKNVGRDGKPVYGGTSDILDDIDCSYTLRPLPTDPVRKEKIVEFENIKRRGNVVQYAAYKYSTENGISYNEILATVLPVDDLELQPLRQAIQTRSDAEIIDAVFACIADGINTKMKLADAASKRAGISKRSALQVIDRYTGDDPAQHRWQFSVHERGAKMYVPLTPAPAISTDATNPPGASQ